MQRAIEVVPEMMCAAKVPPHHRIILDGEIVDTTPVIRCCGCEPAAAHDTEMEAELANQLGEFDVAHQHHLQCSCLQQLVSTTPGGAFLLETVDTDILVINAQRCLDEYYPPAVRVGMGLPKRACLHGMPVDSNATYYFDPHKVRAWGDDLLRDAPLGFSGLVRAFHLGGSDFNGGIPGISSLSFLKDYLLWQQRNLNRSVDDYYKLRLHEQSAKLVGVKNASAKTLNMKHDIQHLSRTSEHPLKRIKWVQEDYWCVVSLSFRRLPCAVFFCIGADKTPRAPAVAATPSMPASRVKCGASPRTWRGTSRGEVRFAGTRHTHPQIKCSVENNKRSITTLTDFVVSPPCHRGGKCARGGLEKNFVDTSTPSGFRFGFFQPPRGDFPPR